MATTPAAEALSATTWPIRLARVLAASFASLSLAAFGHQLGGGQAPPAAPLCLLLAAVASITWLLSRRRLVFVQLLGLLFLAQIAMHLACMASVGMAPMGPAMVIGHVAAIALTAAVLSSGEKCVWAIAERLGFQFIALLEAGHVAPGPARRLAIRVDVARRRSYLLSVGGTGLRGPPVGLR